jgi:hypothetical protein
MFLKTRTVLEFVAWKLWNGWHHKDVLVKTETAANFAEKFQGEALTVAVEAAGHISEK